LREGHKSRLKESFIDKYELLKSKFLKVIILEKYEKNVIRIFDVKNVIDRNTVARALFNVTSG